MTSYYGKVTSKHIDTGHSSAELRFKCWKPAVLDTSYIKLLHNEEELNIFFPQSKRE